MKDKKDFSQQRGIIYTTALLFLMISLPASLCAQDASFSQFFSNPVYYNPAYSGSLLGLRARLNFRHQMHNLPGSYNNSFFCIDVAEPNIPGVGGFGLSIMSDFDGLGNIKTTAATSSVSARIQLTKKLAMQAGLSVAYVHRTIDWNNFVFSDQIHPVYGILPTSSSFQSPYKQSVSYPDFGFGFLFKYYDVTKKGDDVITSLSSAMQHVFRPDISFTGSGAQLPVKIVVMGDLLYSYSPRSISPFSDFVEKFNVGFKLEQQEKMTDLILGVNFYRNPLYFGTWLRSQHFTYANVKDLVFVLGLSFSVADETSVRVLYSYDHTISKLRRTFGATHEVSIIFGLEGFSFIQKNLNSVMGLPSKGGLSGNRAFDCSSF